MSTMRHQHAVDSGMPTQTHEGRGGAHEQPNQELSRALGWFSVGLGATQLLAPNQVNRLIGVDADGKNRALQRAIGLRELLAGAGILTNRQPALWLWARVGGDAMDAALLTLARSTRDNKTRITPPLAAVLAVMVADAKAAMDATAATGTASGERPADGSIPVERAITVWRQPDEVYAFWRNFENLPRFMNHLESVQLSGGGRSHWVAKGPAGKSVEWDAEIVEDKPGELIAWRAIEGSGVWSAGTVRFKPTPDRRGTELSVHLHYAPPVGVVGMTVAKLFGEEPAFQLREDLRRFKQVMEVGEVVLSDAIVERGARIRQQVARPPSEVPDDVPPTVYLGDLADQSGAAASV